MATISGTITHAVTLATSGVYASPLTISGTGAVNDTAAGNAIYGPNTQAWTVVNQGMVSAANGAGIDLTNGGVVINSATILSPNSFFTVAIAGAPGFLSNSQTGYVGPGGVIFSGGGTVVNAGRIADTGGRGVVISGAAGMVINSGTITGSTLGIDLTAGGTVVDSGTISGTSGAISFAGSANRLVLDQGYHLGGVVIGSTASGASNTLELGSASSAGTVTTALATEFVNFGTVTVDPGARWTLTGTSSLAGIALTDLGSLTNSGSLSAQFTVANGGYFNNTAAFGTTAGANAVVGGAGGATIVNSGTMLTNGLATFNMGFTAAGFLTNSQSGYIGTGGIICDAGGTVANAGRIVDIAGDGVEIVGGAGTVTNSGTITGSTFGIIFTAGGTVVDSGTISSASGTAVSFAGASSNLLVLEHGYHFNGVVVGSSSATNTVELAGSVGAPVTVSVSGLGLTNFQNVLFGTGGNDALAVTTASGTLPMTLSGFTLSGDIVDLTGLAFAGTTSVGFNPVTNMLKVTEGAASVTIQLDSENYSGIAWAAQNDGTGGTDIAPVCFCRGTMILTADGEVPVEELAVGDRVVTLSGAEKPIVWIGIGRDLVTRANKLARPIMVRQGALADNVPHSDLYLTHGHALYLDGVLIPVENLVNHRSIVWDESARVVEYYHIELEDHDVVLAEGAAAETYYDADNRALFHNTRPGSVAAAAKPTFAAVLNGGAIVDRVWADLLARSGGTTETDTTDDPDLHLVVDGIRLDAKSSDRATYNFVFAAPPTGVLRLCSRHGVPSLLGITPHDHRRLGVALVRLESRQQGVLTCIEHHAPSLAEAGCYRPESGYCWTDGEALLPARLFAHLEGPFTLTVHTERPGMRYAILPTAAAA